MKKTVITLLFAIGFLSAQVYNIGDVVADFSDPICDNGEGTLNLHDYFYEENGGDQFVIPVNRRLRLQKQFIKLIKIRD